MKFKIDGKSSDDPVALKLDYDNEGEPVVKANGIPVLYFIRTGQIELNTCDGGDLTDMGFQVDESGSVEVIYE